MYYKYNAGEIGAFALPVFVEQTSMAVISLITTMIVSHVGPEAVSGVSLIESLNFIIQQLFLSVEIGATVVIAQYCGRADTKSAGEASVQAMLTSLGLATLLSILMLIFSDSITSMLLGKADILVLNEGRKYFVLTQLSFPFLAIYAITSASLRGSGNPKLSLVSVVVTNFSFLIFGSSMVYGFHMGVTGIGLSLIISRILGAITGIMLLKFKNDVLVITNWIPKRFDWQIQKSILLIGIPSAIENIIFLAGRLTTQTFTVGMGTASMAVNAISNSIGNFYNIPGNTASAITIPIVGKYLGMKDAKNAKDSSRAILLFATVSLTFVSIVMFLLGRPIAALFTDNRQIMDGVVLVSRANYIASPFLWAISFLLPSVLRASGDMKYTTIVSITSMLLVRVTTCYILAVVLHFGVIGIWLGMFTDWVVRGIFFGIRYLNGSWLKREIFLKKRSS